MLVTNLATASCIILSILLLNPMIAFAIVVGLAGGYALIYFVLRNRLLQLGQAQSRAGVEQAQILQESLGAIKEIIVLQAQNFFRGRFDRSSRSFSLAAAQAHGGDAAALGALQARPRGHVLRPAAAELLLAHRAPARAHDPLAARGRPRTDHPHHDSR